MLLYTYYAGNVLEISACAAPSHCLLNPMEYAIHCTYICMLWIEKRTRVCTTKLCKDTNSADLKSCVNDKLHKFCGVKMDLYTHMICTACYYICHIWVCANSYLTFVKHELFLV